MEVKDKQFSGSQHLADLGANPSPRADCFMPGFSPFCPTANWSSRPIAVFRQATKLPFNVELTGLARLAATGPIAML
jgi:hypothetical protein